MAEFHSWQQDLTNIYNYETKKLIVLFLERILLDEN